MKKILFIIILFLVFIPSIFAFDFELNSKNTIVYNVTEDRIMYENSAYDETLVASLTKIMTAIVVIENNTDLDKMVVVKDGDLKDMYEYTTIGLQEGYEISIRDLLYGILLKSGSDAVNAAVRATTSTEKEFVNLMNQKVHELGLTHTYFSNPIGKDDQNYSSAYDIAKIMQYCLKNEIFKSIISTDYYVVENLDIEFGGPLHLSDSKYNVDTSIIKGSKSGYTPASNFSLVSYSYLNESLYIIVTLNTVGYTNLLSDTVKLYDYYLNNYSYMDYNINFKIDIIDGKQDAYNIDINNMLYLQNDYDEDKISYKYNGKDKINFLITKGSVLGKVSIYYDNTLLKTVDVLLKDDIKYNAKIYFKISTFIIIIILLFLLIIFIKFKKKILNCLKIIKKKRQKKKNIKYKKQQERLTLKTSRNADRLLKEENSLEKKLKILKTTININLFFDTLKSVNYTSKDKCDFEKNFIDRCFQKINFKNLDDLQDLYTKLNLFKQDMDNNTIKYYNKLFKYCIKEYINKNKT